MATLCVCWQQSSCQPCLVTSLCSVEMRASPSPVRGANDYKVLTVAACECEECNMVRLADCLQICLWTESESELVCSIIQEPVYGDRVAFPSAAVLTA